MALRFCAEPLKAERAPWPNNAQEQSERGEHVTSSDALVTSSFFFFLVMPLLLAAMPLLLVASSY